MNQKNLIRMTVPTDSSNISVVRMTASSIANRVGFNIEEIDDVKIAVSEACTNVIKHSKVSNFDLFFAQGSNFMEIEIQDRGIGYDFSSLKDPELNDQRESGGLGIYIIKMLMDEVIIDSELNKGTTIYMRKQIGKEE
ncbi:MAG: ATP-binding protein [Peptostreptococcaceae bacterium]|nr:ATP-binding protein [Peptostreptococcaceae bacterium]